MPLKNKPKQEKIIRKKLNFSNSCNKLLSTDSQWNIARKNNKKL